MKVGVQEVLAGFILIILLHLFSYSDSMGSVNRIPPMITGTWIASQIVTVRFEDERGEYRLVSDTVLIRITIDGNGLVEGICGKAVFEGCIADENRGWFGKFFNLSTDFVFEGKLIGKIFDMDPIPEKTIRASFDLKGGYLMGTLFQQDGWEKHPMVEFKFGKR